jgi:hypothetical protein
VEGRSGIKLPKGIDKSSVIIRGKRGQCENYQKEFSSQVIVSGREGSVLKLPKGETTDHPYGQ